MFVFDKLGLAEQRGLGFNTIRKLPKNQMPVVTFDAPNIVITIPLTSNGPVKKVTIKDGLAFIKERGLVTRQDYQEHFELTAKTAIRQINKLIESGDIMPIGKGKDTQYKPAE
jgi:predicted HTH transcriptional regulator